jgi:hypothetical protein
VGLLPGPLFVSTRTSTSTSTCTRARASASASPSTDKEGSRKQPHKSLDKGPSHETLNQFPRNPHGTLWH